MRAYAELTQNLPKRLALSEPDPSRAKFSVSFDIGDRQLWINADTVRTQIDFANFFHLGLLKDKSFVEVGGGYGRLAHAILTHLPESRYAIVDFPQVLEVVERWIRFVAPEIPIYSQRSNRFVNDDCDPGLHLLPNDSALHHVRADLVINVNSFYEMRSDQIQKYLGEIMRDIPLVYSHNRDRQPDNFELHQPLRQNLENYGSVYSWSAAGRDGAPQSDQDKWISVVKRKSSSWRPPPNVGSVLALPSSIQAAID